MDASPSPNAAAPDASAAAPEIVVEPRAEVVPPEDAAKMSLAGRLAGIRTAVATRLSAMVAGSQRPSLAAVAGIALATGALGLALGAVSATKLAPAAMPAAPAAPKAAAAAPTPAPAPDIKALNATLAQLRGEVAALKAASEQSSRSLTSHFAKLGDRVERIEKGQAEPAGRFAKLNEAVDRLEQRLQQANAAPETTGSIPPRAPAAPAPAPAAQADAVPLPPTPPVASGAPKSAVVDGWRVRDVYDGAALLQGRTGVIEVMPGDTVPGAGRVQAIRRMDGRWVVVTSRGTILSLR